MRANPADASIHGFHLVLIASVEDLTFSAVRCHQEDGVLMPIYLIQQTAHQFLLLHVNKVIFVVTCISYQS